MEALPGHNDDHFHSPGAVGAREALGRCAGIVAVHVQGGVADAGGLVACQDFDNVELAGPVGPARAVVVEGEAVLADVYGCAWEGPPFRVGG